MKFQCNRAYINNYIPEKQLNLYRSTKSIRCGCDWVVNFRFSDHKKKTRIKMKLPLHMSIPTIQRIANPQMTNLF